MRNQTRPQAEQYFYNGTGQNDSEQNSGEAYMQENYESVDNAGQMSFPDGTNPEWNADGSAEAHYYDQMAYSNNQMNEQADGYYFDQNADGYYNDGFNY